MKHLRVQQVWDYVHFKMELTDEEQSHLAACHHCLKIVDICGLADSPFYIQLDEQQQQSA